jgi:hypothetical protein
MALTARRRAGMAGMAGGVVLDLELVWREGVAELFPQRSGDPSHVHP